jgi:hypothetical protein
MGHAAFTPRWLPTIENLRQGIAGGFWRLTYNVGSFRVSPRLQAVKPFAGYLVETIPYPNN